MLAKICLAVMTIAVVNALPQKISELEPAYSSQKILLQHGHAKKIVVDGHAKYEFAYKVKDPHTRDVKSQHEKRDGDVVKGVYRLDQPDGTVRVVEYHSDKKNGFKANVKVEGHPKHIIPAHHHRR